MRYLSVCSGIEAASVAWHHLGWEPVGFAEIEKFPSQVLAHRFPGVKNFGDMTKFKEWDIEPGTIDLLVGGTPCQAFSVAGLRKGLADPRGNLALTFVGMVDHYRPEWVVWENVPGVLSSNGGRDFGAFLGALAELGYGFAYRMLDAQYFGVAQRRRRLFLVGHSSGDPRRCASVLFEPESLCGNPSPGRQTRQDIASDIETSPSDDDLRIDGENVKIQLKQEAICIKGAAIGRKPEAGPQYGEVLTGTSYTLNCVDRHGVMTPEMHVRRLTPMECERLQGFPDGWTDIRANGKDTPDSPRYKALGNSMAVPVMRWIGMRIALQSHQETNR